MIAHIINDHIINDHIINIDIIYFTLLPIDHIIITWLFLMPRNNVEKITLFLENNDKFFYKFCRPVWVHKLIP